MAPSPLSSSKKRTVSSTSSPLSPTPSNPTTSTTSNNSSSTTTQTTTASKQQQQHQQQQQNGIKYTINPNLNAPRRVLKKMKWWERTWVWYEGSFAISMLETWEKVVLHIFLITLFSLLSYASVRYLPDQVLRVAGRVKYYVSGSE